MPSGATSKTSALSRSVEVELEPDEPPPVMASGTLNMTMNGTLHAS